MRVLVGSLIVAGALLLLAPAGALAAPADDPVDLGGAYVLDESGVLGGDAATVRAAIDSLYDETGAKVFVVYVDTFENPADAQGWADDSATRSGLGDADLLLAIATRDRNYAYSTGTDFPVSDGDIERVVQDDLIPQLRDDHWAQGAISFADGLRAAQAPSPVPAVVGGVAAAGVGTAVVVGVVRSRRKKKAVEKAAAADAAALDQKAGILLVQLDDALKTSEQELGFAQAQFGEKQTTDFEAALTEAKGLAKQAFELQQKLDDAFPETPEQRRSMTEQLIALAEQADGVLDAQAAAFDELRQLEKNAPAVLDTVADVQQGLDARIDAAAKTIAALKKTYPDADLSSVGGAPAQARKLDRFAASTVADARAVIAKAGADRSGVAVAVRAAQQAVGQVEQLLASIDRAKADLEAKAKQDAAAVAALDGQLRDARSRVQEANDYIATHRGAVGSTARTRVSEATRHLELAVAAGVTAEAAMKEATDAESMAAIALDLAMSDVEQAESALAAPQNQGSYQQGSGFDGAILGGILGSLFGDGDSSSSSSSSSWWGGGSSSGGWSSSGWGGGSSHHSSGGSIFGGGGGHSSGGFSGRSSRTSGRSGGHGRF
ncbi:MAG: TPM domain-containing protein [Microbacteriaceae bacterium]